MRRGQWHGHERAATQRRGRRVGRGTSGSPCWASWTAFPRASWRAEPSWRRSQPSDQRVIGSHSRRRPQWQLGGTSHCAGRHHDDPCRRGLSRLRRPRDGRLHVLGRTRRSARAFTNVARQRHLQTKRIADDGIRVASPGLDSNGTPRLLEGLIGRMKIVVVVAGLALLTASCTGDSSLTQPGSSQSVPPATPSSGSVTDIQSFVSAMEAGGHKVKVGPVVIPPGYGGFGRRARKITVDGYDVWVFQFPTVSASRGMRSQISDDGQRIGDATFVWNPHIYGSGRLIVLYVGNRASTTRDALDELFGKQFAGV
jgi:hypothetical protein